MEGIRAPVWVRQWEQRFQEMNLIRICRMDCRWEIEWSTPEWC